MLLPLSWLKQFVTINKTPEQIGEKLTLSGSEVEKITRADAGISKVVVGHIKEIKQHPNADKLQLAYMDVGKGKPLEIVCGAKNIEVGQKVPCVLLGGSVPGLKIEPREIRGVKSQGMLAGGDELGVSDDHSGIFILPQDAKIGTDVVKLLELDEPVLELDITPNRPDCFSVRGLAREVAALYKVKVKSNKEKVKESSKRASSAVSVRVEDAKLCHKYCARVIEGVSVGPSPLWLANKLRQVGIRSINNIVDVTNYVMMELGQPLHAFDFDLLAGTSTRPSPLPSPKGEGTIVVRKARKGEKLAALDENTYTLDSSMLVIANKKKPVAIAGVMGGIETAVREGTKNIVLEAAVFDSVSVRKTSRTLGLRSESSTRFEKGVDSEAVEEAINRAAGLIAKLAGGTVLRGIVSAAAPTQKARVFALPIGEVSRLLGVDVPIGKIKSILESLGFETQPPLNPPLNTGGEKFVVRVPSWRTHDVSIPADLVEEIGRMLDYNTLPKTLPSGALQSIAPEPLHELRRSLRRQLTAAGFSELLTYSFYDEKLLALSGVKESGHMLVTNPVSAENNYLRANLLPWMLAKLSQNSSLLSRDQFCLFEIGKVFIKPRTEKWQLAVGLIDVTASDEAVYRRLRGLNANGEVMMYPKGSVSNLRFRSSVGVLLVDLGEAIKRDSNERRIFQPLPYYPLVERDLALIAPNAVQYQEIEEVMQGSDPLLKAVELFDVYHGLGEGTSLAFRLTFGSTDRTLEAREVDDILERLKKTLQKKYNVAFR